MESRSDDYRDTGETRHVRLYLAPLQGVGDYIFRKLLAEHFGGFDLAIAPFISTHKNREYRPSLLREVLPEHNLGLKVVPQIVGNDGEDALNLIKALADLGYDEVNLNLGCPFPTLTKKRKGAGLLLHPELIERFLGVVTRGHCLKLSVKTRIGFGDSHEIDRLLPIFNAFPLTEVIVHPRTALQKYDGLVDLSCFERCIVLSVHPLVYNGDIVSEESFRRISRRFSSIDRFMIGRGAVLNPFLGPQIRGRTFTLEERRKNFHRFHTALVEAYSIKLSGEKHVLDRMKGFWLYFANLFSEGESLKKRLCRLKSLDRFQEAVSEAIDREELLRLPHRE